MTGQQPHCVITVIVYTGLTHHTFIERLFNINLNFSLIEAYFNWDVCSLLKHGIMQHIHIVINTYVFCDIHYLA